MRSYRRVEKFIGQSFRLGEPVLRWFRAALVKLADVKIDPQWKVVVAHKESTWRQSQKPDERRLPVKGQSAPHVTSSVRTVWPFFDWRQPQISCWLLLNRCDIFTTYVTPVIIRKDRCALWKSIPQWTRFCGEPGKHLRNTSRYFLPGPISKIWKGSSRRIM